MPWNSRRGARIALASLIVSALCAGSACTSRGAPASADVASGIDDAPGTLLTDCEVLVVGASLGAVTAAYEAAANGADTCLVAPRAMLGGQLTEQATPEDGLGDIQANLSSTYDFINFRTLGHYAAHDLGPGSGTPESLAGALSPWGSTQWSATRSQHTYLGRFAMAYGDAPPHAFEPGQCGRANCYEPRVADHVIVHDLLGPLTYPGAETTKRTRAFPLRIFRGRSPIGVDLAANRVTGVTFGSNGSGTLLHVAAALTIDASDLGDLYPLVWPNNDLYATNPADPNIGYFVGRDGYARFGETSEATGSAAPVPSCVQPFTYVFAMTRGAVEPGTCAPPTMQPPATYDEAAWDARWPIASEAAFYGTQTNSDWVWRRILGDDYQPTLHLPPYPQNLFDGTTPDVTTINGANDFNVATECVGHTALGCNPIAGAYATADVLARGRTFALEAAYHVQRKAQRQCWSTQFTLRPDLLRRDAAAGAAEVAAYPYVREARRLNALHVIRETASNAVDPGVRYRDSVGLAHYLYDLHLCATGSDVDVRDRVPQRLQIPWGALVPRAIDGLIAGSKDLGVTHIMNGEYRIHPVEANVGQAAGVGASVLVHDQMDTNGDGFIEPDEMLDSPRVMAEDPVTHTVARADLLNRMQSRLVAPRPIAGYLDVAYVGSSPLSWDVTTPRMIVPGGTQPAYPNPAWAAAQLAAVGASDAAP